MTSTKAPTVTEQDAAAWLRSYLECQSWCIHLDGVHRIVKGIQSVEKILKDAARNGFSKTTIMRARELGDFYGIPIGPTMYWSIHSELTNAPSEEEFNSVR